MKAEYIKEITRLMNESNDLGLLDFIYQLLMKRNGKSVKEMRNKGSDADGS